MKTRIITVISTLAICLGTASCSIGNGQAEGKALGLYNDLLKKVISGEEMFSDAGEGYEYKDAKEPGYALYDIDQDGMDELFITPDIGEEWHTYSVYYIKDDNVIRARALNGYIPDKDCWTYSFDFFVEGYTYKGDGDFARIWELDYPWVDGYEVNTINYEGQEPREIKDEELKELLSGHITEPEDLVWMPVRQDTDLRKDAINH